MLIRILKFSLTERMIFCCNKIYETSNHLPLSIGYGVLLYSYGLMDMRLQTIEF